MATATEVRYRPEDLLAITDRPMPELVDGRLVEREMSQRSDAIAARILILIGQHAGAGALGLVNGAQGSYQVFPDDPGKVRVPDVSFTRAGRLPAHGPSDGHGRVVPDLVVEVISPHDSADELAAKVEDYLSAGVPLIWVVSPESRTVQVIRRDGTAAWLRAGDAIDGGDILPGFACDVGRFFLGL